MAGELSFRQKWELARVHQSLRAPAIHDVDPSALAVRSGTPSRPQEGPAPAIGDVDQEVAGVRDGYARSRQSLRDLVASNEASSHGYDSYFGDYRQNHPARPDKPLSRMTLNEIYAYQDRLHRATEEKNGRGSTPVGRYQLTKQALQEAQRGLGISSDHVFDEVLQDALADERLKFRGFNKYANGEISAADFHDNLASEWDSIEWRDTGESRTHNPAKTTGTQVRKAISEIDRDRGQLRDRYKDEHWEEE